MHDKVLKLITKIAGCGFMLFLSGFDSGTTGCVICTIGTFLCLGWVALFAAANPGGWH